VDVLLLIRSKNIGPRSFFDLVGRYGSAESAIAAIKEMRNKPYQLCTKDKVEKEIELTHKIGANFITYMDKDYPAILQNLPCKPPIITYLGNIALLHQKICSIVGSRNASFHGQNFARKISAELSENDICICSGLARGIDTEAHRSAKNTIAVIAGGINHIYPKENESLYKKIANEGLVLSENPINFSPMPESFPKRNRIIAGLAKAIIIVEANIKSGSLITAKFGLEFNREIGAVPGSVFDSRSSGCHKLIKEGAALIENTDDILELLGPDTKINEAKSYNTYSKETEKNIAAHQKNIYKLLSANPISVDEVVEVTNLPLSEVNLILLELELEGNVMRYPGNKFALQL
jgi:DNA processing protein